jgi:hypothetical protein
MHRGRVLVHVFRFVVQFAQSVQMIAKGGVRSLRLRLRSGIPVNCVVRLLRRVYFKEESQFIILHIPNLNYLIL